jgi:hypothetical protein
MFMSERPNIFSPIFQFRIDDVLSDIVACLQYTVSSPYWAGIFKQSTGARHRVGIGLSYRPVRLHRLAEFIPRNRFLGSINV